MLVRQCGLTLLEVLIVMIIIAVMVGASTMMLKRDHQDLILQEADRLRALIALGRDEAVFQSRSLGIYFTDNSYVFMNRSDHEGEQIWSPLPDRHFRKRELTNGVKLALFREETKLNLQAEEEVMQPQIFLLSTGEVTPCKLELFIPAKAAITLDVDGLGQIEVSSK